jgi:fibronectin-binding autotransporter adhesin
VQGFRWISLTINVNSGATLRFDSGNMFSTNFSSSALPSLNITGTATNGASATNNALGNVTLTGGTLTATTGHATYGAFNLNGTVTSTGTSTISTSDAVNGRMMLSSAGANNVDTPTTFDVQDTLTVSAPLADLFVAESKIGGLSKTNTGLLILTGTNTYTGATSIRASPKP